jgi:glucokinase
MILAGDVGGTKTNLALFKTAGGGLRLAAYGSFPSQEYGSLVEIVGSFMTRRKERVKAAAFGVAGPVVRGRSQVVNLRWPVDSKRLARALGLDEVRLLNDLEATAWGVPELSTRKISSLTPGLRSRPGNGALIAAGTGLGMALMLWDGERFHPCASEGGHQSFGPRNELEDDLLRYMRARHGRVSMERIISGPGFSAIYDFLVESGRNRESARMKRRLAAAADRNQAISEAGMKGVDAVSAKVLKIFISLYGAAAGDLALVARATSGLYVGGGIAPKILDSLRDGEFVRAFRNKGRLTPVVEKIPVRVILEPRTALFGAAACAKGG